MKWMLGAIVVLAAFCAGRESDDLLEMVAGAAALPSAASPTEGAGNTPRETGFGAPVRFVVGASFLGDTERNDWVGEPSDGWHESEWISFGNAGSQRPHASVGIHHAHRPIRFNANVEAEARELAAFGDYRRVFSGTVDMLETSFARFKTTRFAYELPGGGTKNCLSFHADRVRPKLNVEGFLCQHGPAIVSPLAATCLLETLRVPAVDLAGHAPAACRGVTLSDPARGFSGRSP